MQKKTPLFEKKNGVSIRHKNIAHHTFTLEMQSLPCQ
jgi:hypothetical protein